MKEIRTSVFAPQLHIRKGVTNIDFYKSLGAIELRSWKNDDDTYHVAELSIDGTIFHLHEETQESLSPEHYNGTTVTIGLFVSDVDKIMKNAIAAGAVETSPPQDCEYGYRQGKFKDPFGLLWFHQIIFMLLFYSYSHIPGCY